MNTQPTDVLIVGSGPNALSLATHLRARGVEHRIFGPPMKFWRDMPPGLNLKSLAFATNVYTPEKGRSFPEWCLAQKLEDFEPCPMETFAAYGMWCRDQLVPYLEDVVVTHARAVEQGFEITTSEGVRHRGRRLVLATGLSNLAVLPESLRQMPAELVRHTFDVHRYESYRGARVAVVGAGASAVEAGVLVHEAGGSPHVIVRHEQIVFHGKTDRKRTLYQRLRYPESVLGPSPKNWALQNFPLALHFAPERLRLRLLRSTLGPASPWWIKSRFDGKVSFQTQSTIRRAEVQGSGVRLTLEENGGTKTLEVDRVICGTGYEANVDKLAYLDEALRRKLKRIGKAPVLSRHFESSIKGLYFMGPMTAPSFGPLFRFVAGGKVAAPVIARHLARARRMEGEEWAAEGVEAV